MVLVPSGKTTMKNLVYQLQQLGPGQFDSTGYMNFISQNRDKITQVTKKITELMQDPKYMPPEALREDPAHGYEHLARVFANCWRIIHMEKLMPHVNMKVLLWSVIGHDVINYPKNSPLRSKASEHSANFFRHVMYKTEVLPVPMFELVQHAITTHSYSAGQVAGTIEAKVLQDADRLDALGMVGMARMLIISGSLNRDVTAQDDIGPKLLTRELDDKKYAFDHLYVKLKDLPGLMNYEYSKSRGAKLFSKMEDFVKQYRDEIYFA